MGAGWVLSPFVQYNSFTEFDWVKGSAQPGRLLLLSFGKQNSYAWFWCSDWEKSALFHHPPLFTRPCGSRSMNHHFGRGSWNSCFLASLQILSFWSGGLDPVCEEIASTLAGDSVSFQSSPVASVLWTGMLNCRSGGSFVEYWDVLWRSCQFADNFLVWFLFQELWRRKGRYFTFWASAAASYDASCYVTTAFV
jgi:hypothetical protein